MKKNQNIYKNRESLIIIGLTGRTGSGCSRAAGILKQKKLTLKDEVDSIYFNNDKNKYKIVREFITKGDKWQPFHVIEMSSMILSVVLEQGLDELLAYCDSIQDENNGDYIKIGEYDKLQKNLKNLTYMFDDAKKNSFNDNNTTPEKQFDFYLNKVIDYKRSIKRQLQNFSCYETKKPKFEGRVQKKLDLYTFLMQRFGNNIRSSGNPYQDEYIDNEIFLNKIDTLIKLIIQHDEKNKKNTRICIDAIRNPYEALYLKDIYRRFYLVSVNTEDDLRRSRLKELLDEDQLNSLDSIEYPKKLQSFNEIFYHQNIQKCLEISDIHIYNPYNQAVESYIDGEPAMTEQLIKYIALILHPGLITPTPVEFCMQTAFNAKVNSGCLSRKVGAVVAREDYSICSIGWNNAPDGQTPCNLRNITDFCKNKPQDYFSHYELTNQDFFNNLTVINEHLQPFANDGLPFSFCFKDIYNAMCDSKNQVHTRSLHAEENAFLKISKYGGQGIKGGFLFTTASPCELCSKKAYQLGIKRIYYIDPYPGISKDHILSFGNEGNPELCLFNGAIGDAYLSLYYPRIDYKDELEILTNINMKKMIKEKGTQNWSNLSPGDIQNKKVEIEFKFNKTRSDITITSSIEFRVLCNGIKNINKYLTWTGDSYEGSTLLSSSDNYTLEDCQDKKSPYRYSINLMEERGKNYEGSYKLETSVKDASFIMQPYMGYAVSNPTDHLILRVIAPNNIIKNVKKVIYADFKMEHEVYIDECIPTDDDANQIFEFDIKDVNLFYNYNLQWEF